MQNDSLNKSKEIQHQGNSIPYHLHCLKVDWSKNHGLIHKEQFLRLAVREGLDEIEETFPILISMISWHRQNQVHFTREAGCCEPWLLNKVSSDLTLAFLRRHLAGVSSTHSMEDPDSVPTSTSELLPKGSDIIYCPFPPIPKVSSRPSGTSRLF